MPPLYRMPVFYLAALVLTAAVGVGSWVRARPNLTPDASATAAPAAQPRPRKSALHRSIRR